MDKKNKNNKNKKIFLSIKTIILLTIFIMSFLYTVKFLDEVNLKVDDLFLKTLVSKSNNIKIDGFSSEVVNYISMLDLFDPLKLLKNNYKGLNSNQVNTDTVMNDNNDDDTPNVNPSDKDSNETEQNPIVYIYNTHQSEEYASLKGSNYDIAPSVLLASYILQEKLEHYGITSIVEESNIEELLRINNWNYASSYKITRMLMEQAKEDYPSLIYFIDLHRDSVSYDKTTININNKSYAKVLFLLGMENSKYKESEEVISRLNTIISGKYNGISKGIYKKSGPGVNGVYNQDFSSRCVLIEVGGVDNNIVEVSNTIDAIAYMLSTYIGEDHE